MKKKTNKESKKSLSSKKSKTKKLENKKKKLQPIILKLFLITILMYSLYIMSLSYSNTINLLAVSEDENGKTTSGSIIKLNLEIKPGSGETFVNLNTIREVDTQISILNSKKAACLIFELDCNKYDFYYDFQGSALILKGPSASTAIAILTAKTVNKEHLNNKVTITGSLSSGGLIGSVGGIEEKVKIAKLLGHTKVLVPFFSKYNQSDEIEVVPVLDIVSAYNEFGFNKYELKKDVEKTPQYIAIMKKLSEEMCTRSNELKNLIEIENIDSNSSLKQNLETAKQSYNSSQITYQQENYYSTGSFCYNSNINYRIIREIQKNSSLNELKRSIERLNEKIANKEKEIENIAKNISSLNDFYVTLLLFDRTSESRDFLKTAKEELEKNNTNEERIRVLYSQSIERLYTVELWGLFIQNKKSNYKFNKKTLSNACNSISKDLSIKAKLLEEFGIKTFEEFITEQNSLLNSNENKYVCIYQGLELLGRMDTLLNSVNIDTNASEKYVENIVDFTQKRIGLNSNGDFPFIPYIYLEYSSDLFTNKDYYAAMLYANYALSYSDLNLYLKEEKVLNENILRGIYLNLFENFWFVLAILLLIGFI